MSDPNDTTIQSPKLTIAHHLNALEWDGGERLNHWLTNYLGVELTPRASVLGRKWMIAAVARALQPGCDVPWVLVIDAKQEDETFVLEGLRSLGETFGHATHPCGFDARDAREAKAAKWWAWITVHVEVAQRGVALGNAISFATSPTDRFRKPFTTEVKDLLRDWIMVLMSNDVSPEMRDSRRLHIIRAARPAQRKADVDASDAAKAVQAAMEVDRHQLLAEAVAAFRAGESWQVPS